MASLVKQHGRYALQFYDPERRPARKRCALKTSDKRAAKRKRSELEQDYVLGRFDPWTDDPFHYKKEQARIQAITIKDALNRFIDAKRATGRSENTLRTYSHIIGLFARTIGDDTVVQGTMRDNINSFVRDSGVAPSTKLSRYKHLKAFFNWCCEEKLSRDNPMSGIEAPDGTHRLPKAMDESDLDAICKALQADYDEKLKSGACRGGELIWQIPLFRFAFFTGMRASELARLRWKDIDFEHGLIYILEQKNKKQQSIPLNSVASEIISAIKQGAPKDYVFVSPQAQSQDRSTRSFVWHVSLTFRTYRRLAKIERSISFHSLRHGFCTMLAQAGKSAALIQKAARHSNIQTTMRYVDLTNMFLKQELDDVFV